MYPSYQALVNLCLSYYLKRLGIESQFFNHFNLSSHLHLVFFFLLFLQFAQTQIIATILVYCSC